MFCSLLSSSLHIWFSLFGYCGWPLVFYYSSITASWTHHLGLGFTCYLVTQGHSTTWKECILNEIWLVEVHVHSYACICFAWLWNTRAGYDVWPRGCSPPLITDRANATQNAKRNSFWIPSVVGFIQLLFFLSPRSYNTSSRQAEKWNVCWIVSPRSSCAWYVPSWSWQDSFQQAPWVLC